MGEADTNVKAEADQGAGQATRVRGQRTGQDFARLNISPFTSTDARQSARHESTSSSPITERKKHQSARDIYAQYQISRPSG